MTGVTYLQGSWYLLDDWPFIIFTCSCFDKWNIQYFQYHSCFGDFEIWVVTSYFTFLEVLLNLIISWRNATHVVCKWQLYWHLYESLSSTLFSAFLPFAWQEIVSLIESIFFPFDQSSILVENSYIRLSCTMHHCRGFCHRTESDLFLFFEAALGSNLVTTEKHTKIWRRFKD